jgi:hypothetical protein
MSIISEAVSKAQADLARLSASISEWTESYLELLGNLAHTDLIFQEAGALDVNFLALCLWDDPSNLLVLQVIPPTRTEQDRKRLLAMTSVIAAALYDLGHYDVAIVLLSDDVGKGFRHEGLAGHSKTIGGCSRMAQNPSQIDFSSIAGHVEVCGCPRPFAN